MPGCDENKPRVDGVNTRIYVVTPTWDRPGRMGLLRRMARVFKKVRGLFWVLVEDGPGCALAVSGLLVGSGIDHAYLHFGPTRDVGNSQRNCGLEYLDDHGLDGVVYLADDDNAYTTRLFEEIRTVRRVGIIPVNNLGPSGVERPRVRDGKIIGWDAGWRTRKYPLDFAGFAFHTIVLKGIMRPFIRGFNWVAACRDGKTDPSLTGTALRRFLRRNKDGETEFLEKFVRDQSEFELLADSCRRSGLVWHNPGRLYWLDQTGSLGRFLRSLRKRIRGQ